MVMRTPDEAAVVLAGGGLAAAFLARLLTSSGIRTVIVDGDGDGLQAWEPTVPATSFAARLIGETADVDVFRHLGDCHSVREHLDPEAVALGAFGLGRSEAARSENEWMQLLIPGEHDETVLRPAAIEKAMLHDCPPDLLVDRRDTRVVELSDHDGRSGRAVLADGTVLATLLTVTFSTQAAEGPWLVRSEATVPGLDVAIGSIAPDVIPGVRMGDGAVTLTAHGRLTRIHPLRHGHHVTRWSTAETSDDMDDLQWMDHRGVTWTHERMRVGAGGGLTVDESRGELEINLPVSLGHGMGLQWMLELAVLLATEIPAGLDSPLGLGRRLAYARTMVTARHNQEHHMNSMWMAASGSWATTSLAFRLWFAQVMFSALSLRGFGTSLHRGQAGLSMRGRARPETGAYYVTLPELHQHIAAASSLFAQGGASRAPEDSAEEIYRGMRASRIYPPIFGFADPRAVTYELTLGRRLRTLAWLVTAPASVRRVLLQYKVLRGGTGRDRTIDSRRERHQAGKAVKEVA